MSQFLRSYFVVAFFGATGVLLGALLLGISSLLRPSRPAGEKSLAMERRRPHRRRLVAEQIRYYVFAVLFVIFDVEAVFIFPWATQLERYGSFGLVEMGIFVFVLLLGLVYAWRKVSCAGCDRRKVTY